MNPQTKGTVQKLYTTNPRKPNSAHRKVAKVFLTNKKTLLCAVKGVSHNLKKFSKVWLAGKGFRDTPSVNIKLIPGKEAFSVLSLKKKRRSFFGLKKGIS
jgi:small subunit ribosomal protein S12